MRGMQASLQAEGKRLVPRSQREGDGGAPRLVCELRIGASGEEHLGTARVPARRAPVQRRPVAIGVACIDVVPLGEPSLRSAAGRQEESTRATKELAARDP